MSTIIKLIPEAHATKRTTWIRLTGDGQITTRVEDPIGTDTDKSFDFSSMNEGDPSPPANEPFQFIDAGKIGTHARYIIGISEFYDQSLTGNSIPQERFIWYDYKTKADDAPDSETIQTFPINVLFSTAGTPDSPTRALSVTTQTTSRIYGSLGTTAARREYLKQLIRVNHVDHKDFQNWLTGFQYHDISGITSSLYQYRANYWAWLEMLTRAISVNTNLEDTTNPTTAGERKFNLLVGDASLSGIDVFNYAGINLLREITNSSNNRTGWTLIRLGEVAAASPYAYTKPTIETGNWGFTGSNANTVANNEITVRSGITIPSGTSWLDWLRQ